MSEMVERIASILGNYLHGDDRAMVEAARAAIAAMREPTPKMLGAGYEQICNDQQAQVTPDARYIWPAMIDAALD